MEHMQYVGPRKELRGHSALVRLAPNPGKVEVQFDFPPDHVPGDENRPAWCANHPLCYGWHEFDERDFAATAELTGHVRGIHELATEPAPTMFTRDRTNRDHLRGGL